MPGISIQWRRAGAAVVLSLLCGCAAAQSPPAAAEASKSPVKEFVVVTSGSMKIDPETSRRFGARVEAPSGAPLDPPFTQAAVKQGTQAARLGPNPEIPYFTVRFALPIPPDDDTNQTASLTGMDRSVWAHNHSPGLEVLPNGDVLAIYFSAASARGTNESAVSARFVQARLRYGAEQWDPPELFFDSRDFNDQSALLWNDGGTVRFFGGGRNISPWLPFKMATSTDNGASWTFSLPQLDKPATDCTPQPIANAFRGPDGALYMAMDAEKNESFLWRSRDGGVHWSDMGGRTGARHSAIVPLGPNGPLLSIGGKNSGIDGYTPQSISTNWGETWSVSKASVFPALGGNQRPGLIKLANGHLCFVTDSYHRSRKQSPAGWSRGEGAFVAISKDDGVTWHMKRLPVELPHEADRALGTLGYATVRQGPNGVLHLLTTMTHPCLHYEFNEAWVFSDAGDAAPESSGGRIRQFTENYPGGGVRATWSARICPNGRYLLEGVEASYYPGGSKEHEARYVAGIKTGEENYWLADGTRVWSWQHDPEHQVSRWTHYWPNGRRRVESAWNTRPRARDLDRYFVGLEANGPTIQWNQDGTPAGSYQFVNGNLAVSQRGPKPSNKP